MKRLFLLLAIGLVAQMGFAQEFDKAKLDSYFDALEANNRFMGSVAVSRNGEIIYTKAIGYCDTESKIKANPNSKYRIGSITKTFTTVLVFKALENGLLDINQTIDKYFPTITNANKITISQLLYHRSGIHSFTSDKDYLTWNTTPKTEKEMLDIIVKGGSDFEPDSKTEYSNSNFVLLTYILEKSFKKPYANLLVEYIINPLGLKNTHLGGKINPKNNECNSYSISGDWKLEPETDISIPLGAGGIVSTPSDLVKFSDALFSNKLLKKESFEQMKTIKDRYGMGLFKVPFYDKVGYGHTGGIDGFASVFTHFSDENISYAMTSNGTNFNNNDISLAVLSAIYGKPYTIPEFKTVSISSEELDKYLGTYSSLQIPLKIMVTKENNTLKAQATGQSAFPLEPSDIDKFKFDLAGIVMEFNPKENTMILKQGGGQFLFTKE
jgi:CubicO group peptidase (beta-lactamase class C family)